MLSLRFNGIPPSYNQHFQILYNLRQCELTPEAREFKRSVKINTPPNPFTEGKTFRLEIEYHHDFFYKNGKNKRIDLQNLDKLLIDAIFEQLGIDDSFVWELQERKVQDKESFTSVNIIEL